MRSGDDIANQEDIRSVSSHGIIHIHIGDCYILIENGLGTTGEIR